MDTPSKEVPDELEHTNGMAPPRLVSNTVITDVEPTLHWRTWLVLFAGCFCWMGINWVGNNARPPPTFAKTLFVPLVAGRVCYRYILT